MLALLIELAIEDTHVASTFQSHRRSARAPSISTEPSRETWMSARAEPQVVGFKLNPVRAGIAGDIDGSDVASIR